MPPQGAIRFDAIGRAWELYKSQMGMWLLISLIVLVISLAVNLAESGDSTGTWCGVEARIADRGHSCARRSDRRRLVANSCRGNRVGTLHTARIGGDGVTDVQHPAGCRPESERSGSNSPQLRDAQVAVVDGDAVLRCCGDYRLRGDFVVRRRIALHATALLLEHRRGVRRFRGRCSAGVKWQAPAEGRGLASITSRNPAVWASCSPSSRASLPPTPRWSGAYPRWTLRSVERSG